MNSSRLDGASAIEAAALQYIHQLRPRTEGRPLPASRKLRVGWILEAPNCKQGPASVIDSLSYRCLFFDALNATTRLLVVDGNTSTHARARLDLMLLPHVCTINTRALPICLRQLLPSDPPALIVVNKVFEALEKKLALIRACGHRVALIVTPSPHATALGRKAGMRAAFFPYAAPLEFGRFADGRHVRYSYEIGFSGGWQKLSGRYPFRKHIFSSNSTARLKAQGVRVMNPGWLPTESYIRAIGSSKMWLATSEQGAHVGPRYFEVMISGRALLLCDRNDEAYALLGVKEGVHAAMFNSTAEFEARLHYYRDAAHEAERQRIVRAARELVLSRHLWSHRAAYFDVIAREALAHVSAAEAPAGGEAPSGHSDEGLRVPGTRRVGVDRVSAFRNVTRLANASNRKYLSRMRKINSVR
ncbi:hypothetical protein AB1Y20_018242 [Prymnesium parvum]|uniref:Spore protein YkvP/CgeB glycosyl transferase-like domain-containing protein n=1 Tax=Prymnesium parvum TaxID=97485 RepID=A0AB34JNC9_PRYPA